MLSPPAEVLLSYFTGLAPVGTLVEPRLAHVLADLGYKQKTSFYRCLNELIRSGCIRKKSVGSFGSAGMLVVVRRLEEMPKQHLPFKPAPEPVLHPRSSVTKIDWAARLAEIPRDTRSLTARIFGDPLPGRSAFDRRRVVKELSQCQS